MNEVAGDGSADRSPGMPDPILVLSSPMPELPSHARVVIVGGGIVGCSVAYHLTKLGWRDVVLLERRDLSCGTTWHAAGLVGQLRSSHNLTRLASYGAVLYEKLEAETGQATGFRRCGSISVARTPERLVELKRGASMARCFGVDIEVISPAEAGRLWPLMRTDDLAGAVWIPGDGRTNPIDTTLALARGARLGGATIVENVTVTGVRRERGAATGVSTDRGDIACEMVVNCAGMWGREVGRMAGVNVPLHASEHFYIVTEPMAGVSRDLPVLRDTDGYIYVREEVGGLLMGGFEPVAKPWGMDGIPDDFKFSLLPEDWEHFRLLMEQACVRIPAIETAPVRRHVNGPESFTPDNRYMLGEAPECRNYFVAAGFNSIGIASAAGAGKALAEWIVGGEPAMDLWDVDIRRFMPFQGNAAYLRERTARGGRAPLRDALALPPAGHRAQRAALGAARPAGRARRRLRRGRGLGARQLVRAAGHEGGVRLHLRPPELVPLRRRRAPRRAGGRGALRPVLAREVPAAGSGCRRHAPAPLRQRRGRPGRADRLHADAQPARRHRVRSHRHASRRGRLPGGDDRGHRRPRCRLDPPRHRRRARHADRRDLGLRGARRDGPALARAAVTPDARRSLDGGVPVRDGARDRARPGPGAGDAHHLRRRAGLGAVRARPSSRPACTTT